MQSYTQSKDTHRKSCQGIFFDQVLDLIPELHQVIITTTDVPYCAKITLEEKDFSFFKFEATKWIKTKEDPIERHWPFEAKGKDGIWSYDKELSIVESRKSQSEKSKQEKESQEMQALFKKHGISHD